MGLKSSNSSMELRAKLQRDFDQFVLSGKAFLVVISSKKIVSVELMYLTLNYFHHFGDYLFVYWKTVTTRWIIG